MAIDKIEVTGISLVKREEDRMHENKFKYGDLVYWVEQSIEGKVAHQHGDLMAGLPSPPEIVFKIMRGLVVSERLKDADPSVVIDVFSAGAVVGRKMAVLFDSLQSARAAANAQFSGNLLITEERQKYYEEEKGPKRGGDISGPSGPDDPTRVAGSQ